MARPASPATARRPRAEAVAAAVAAAVTDRPSPHVNSPPVDAAERALELRKYADETAGCVKCRLAEGRTQVVFGVGNPDADLMFVGEAPGFHEDKQGYPFVG